MSSTVISSPHHLSIYGRSRLVAPSIPLSSIMASQYHSNSDPENSAIHYTFLPDQPDSGHRKSFKVVSGILLSFFLLLCLSAFVILNNQSPDSPSPSPPSRGVSQGVSEKTFRDVTGASHVSYPWSNAMLTWQRTAYHFQPQKNWMNGNFFILTFL